MKMKKKYRRAWINIYDRTEKAFRNIEADKICAPFKYLPQRLFLTREEEALIALFDELEGVCGANDEYFLYALLRSKRVIGVEGFKVVQNRLRELQKDSEAKQISLPNTFLTFFQTHDYLARFRTSDFSFFPCKCLNVFPEDERYFITPFFGDSQGFCWWYLLLNQKGDYCILYNAYHWRETDSAPEDDPIGAEYIICADTFEEFIARLSEDIKIKERKKDFVQKINEQYSRFFEATPKQILERYQK